MENKNNKIKWILVICLIVIAIYGFNAGWFGNQEFIIADSAFGPVEQTLSIGVGGTNQNFTLWSVSNNSIIFKYMNTNYTALSGKVYYSVDESSNLLDAVPILQEGLHNITKFNLTVSENILQIRIWELDTYMQTNLVVPSKQLCEAVGGNYTNYTCVCPDNSEWYDNSTEKVCSPITVTNDVTHNIEIPPTFFDRFGIAIIVLIAAVIIIFIRGKKKK